DHQPSPSQASPWPWNLSASDKPSPAVCECAKCAISPHKLFPAGFMATHSGPPSAPLAHSVFVRAPLDLLGSLGVRTNWCTWRTLLPEEGVGPEAKHLAPPIFQNPAHRKPRLSPWYSGTISKRRSCSRLVNVRGVTGRLSPWCRATS